jgi:hypothetical protein
VQGFAQSALFVLRLAGVCAGLCVCVCRLGVQGQAEGALAVVCAGLVLRTIAVADRLLFARSSRYSWMSSILLLREIACLVCAPTLRGFGWQAWCVELRLALLLREAACLVYAPTLCRFDVLHLRILHVAQNM